MSNNASPCFLTVRQGPDVGRVYPITGSVVTIGRHAGNQIVINDSRVSRHHARLTSQNGAIIAQDLNSANGTWINHQKIASPVRLQNGDMLGLGPEIQLEFHDAAAANDATVLVGHSAPVALGLAPAPGPIVSQPPPKTKNTFTVVVGAAMALIIAVLLFVAGGLLLYRGSGGFLAAAPTATFTATATATTASTYTPYPTYTPAPTEPPTATPYPTYTPVPTEPPTATPYPTYTPYPTPLPTATPYPTYTPAPAKVVVVQPTEPPATATSPAPPTATPPPPFTLTLGNNVGYEPWGKPGNPDGCGAPYDDRIEVRRFTAQVLLTNNSKQFIGEDWWPTFLSGSGAAVPSCWYYYNNVVVEPGETVDVTYATYLPKGDYVRAMVFDILGQTAVICLNGGGQQIPCP